VHGHKRQPGPQGRIVGTYRSVPGR
jgi:hypothetical protein